MKLYTWTDINVYPYAGGEVTVVAENEDQARDYAAAWLDKVVYDDSGYDLSGAPYVQDIVPGAGSAYYWEE